MKVFARAYLCGWDTRPEEMKRRLLLINPGSMVQAARAGTVKNEFLVEMLAAQTLQAEASGSLLAKKPEIDFLLRLAGTTQISRAIREHGAREGSPFILVVAGHSEQKGLAELEGMELPRRTLAASELGRVERAALLNAQRS
ncbi:MAG TPA: KEOPS complex subunit Cgi121 [Nitrososphaerales archaeon]|nr:KEOPS complex subunit Cgi121 [Nitrososphaerales archaeon]